MSLFGKLISLFPFLHGLLIVASVIAFIVEPTPITCVTIVVCTYLFPLFIFRAHNLVCRLEEGTYSIVQGYSPWYGTHMIQTMFIAFPRLETALRLIPGVFSLWLRLWGSKVGSNVYFTPHFEVADRSLLDIGNNCVFGYDVKIASHVISPSRELGLKIYIKKVVIEDGGFVGATSRLAPGVHVKKGALVKATTNVYPDTVVEKRT